LENKVVGLGVMAHVYNPRSLGTEDEARGSRGQPGLRSETVFQNHHNTPINKLERKEGREGGREKEMWHTLETKKFFDNL
jgi:hypothetical protein